MIDLGSNALRLQIVEAVEGGEPVVLARIREPVRLGGDVFGAGSIGDAAIAAAERALAAFRDLCEQYGVQRVRAVATAALREAGNRDAVVRRFSAAAAVPIEVITGTEEAWLLLRAVAARVDLGRGRSLLVDLGGGSAELVVVEDGRAVAADSQPLGALRLIEAARRAAGADHGPAFLALVEQLVGRADHDVADRLGPAPAARMVAVGGSIEALADLEAEAGGRRTADGVESLAVDTLARWIETLAPLPRGERERRFGLLPDRADVIVPALVVYRRLAELAGAPRLLVPRTSLRDGLLRDVLAPPGDAAVGAEWRETLLASARSLAARFRCDTAHAERVREHAASLFDQTAALHGRAPRDRGLLEAAAVLHDAGRFVASARHEEHGAALVRASELVGVSAEEHELVALAVRYHAGAHPAAADAEWAALPAEGRARACVLAALLRLADGLDRAHRGAVTSLALRIGPGAVELSLRRAPDAEGRPLVELDGAREKGALFEAVFGVALRPIG